MRSASWPGASGDAVPSPGAATGTPTPRLVLPTASVRASYLQGETEVAMEEGAPTSWIDAAAADFAGFVARRRAVRELWGVPVTELGLTELLITCGEANIGSRRVIDANGGAFERVVDGEAHYRVPVGGGEPP
jgi:hypothetical protein